MIGDGSKGNTQQIGRTGQTSEHEEDTTLDSWEEDISPLGEEAENLLDTLEELLEEWLANYVHAGGEEFLGKGKVVMALEKAIGAARDDLGDA